MKRKLLTTLLCSEFLMPIPSFHTFFMPLESLKSSTGNGEPGEEWMLTNLILGSATTINPCAIRPQACLQVSIYTSSVLKARSGLNYTGNSYAKQSDRSEHTFQASPRFVYRSPCWQHDFIHQYHTTVLQIRNGIPKDPDILYSTRSASHLT